ncbi:30S ribosomal protein S5 [Candidatus Woesearchaeota archaeon]|nr:30S ribosomal protein S5 [Candidatus Woesearchaeota archaeon]
MAEEKEEIKEEAEEEIIEPEEEEKVAKKIEKPAFDKESWKPRTSLGTKVKNGEITDIDQILDSGLKIMEAEIVDILLADLESDLLLIGQSKGKFGGGQRRVFKQTQKKTQEGNKPKFATFAVVGNRNGYIGIGYGKSKETVPAREKAIRNAKLNIIKIRRGCGSWECGCKDAHSIPFEIQGKCGSVRIKIMPAPKGTGLCVEPECQKILGLAGVKDVWSKTLGQTKTKINVVYACIMAIKNLLNAKVQSKFIEKLGIVEGRLKENE